MLPCGMLYRASPYLAHPHLIPLSLILLFQQFWKCYSFCFSGLFFLLAGHRCLQFPSNLHPQYRACFLEEPRNAITAVIHLFLCVLFLLLLLFSFPLSFPFSFFFFFNSVLLSLIFSSLFFPEGLSAIFCSQVLTDATRKPFCYDQ